MRLNLSHLRLRRGLHELGRRAILERLFPVVGRSMTRWLFTILLCSCFMNIPTGLAFEIPYGVQDPMHAIGFPPCAGGETGYWQFVTRVKSDGRSEVFLVLTQVDLMDPALVICWVDAKERVIAVGPEKHL